jgi:predicted ATPase/DNA-binding XRE family transcriptional regulator
METAGPAIVESVRFGALLKRYRVAAGLSQAALAERARLSERAISAYERGQRQAPYRDTVALLVQALGLSLEEAAALEATVQRRHGPEAAARPAARAVSVTYALETPRSNLLLQLTSFVGRRRALAEVMHLLEQTRLLTLTGAGGTGKTRLALQVAATVLDHYPHGVWVVELAPLADPALVPQTVATVLGMPEDSDERLVTRLQEFVRTRHLLLVLDNCEHLLDACANMAEALLRAGSRLRILATSREALGIAGETSWRVPSLALPDLQHLPPPALLLDCEAVQLFVERAAAVQPHFVLNATNALAVAQVCHRLDGIPLAIELAAARLRGLALDQLLARLDQRFRLLIGGSRTALPRQQTLQATVDWSYALLRAPEKTLFNRLSTFMGGFTLEAAEAVCAGGEVASDTVLTLLLRLVDRSLVLAEERDSGDLRYRLLETLHQYGQERLGSSGEAAMVRTQHAAYYLALGEQAERELHGPAQTRWLDRLDAEYANLAAALDWSLTAAEPQACDVGTGDGDTGLRLAGALWWFWIPRGHRWAGLRWLERALARSQGATPSARAKALLAAGVLTELLGDQGRGQALLEASVALYREGGEQGRLAYALSFLGFFVRGEEVGFDTGHRGDYERGTALLVEGLALARAVGDPWLIMWLLQCLANSTDVHQAAERARGRAAAEEGLRLARTVGSNADVRFLERSLGGLALYEGDYARARAAFSGELADARAAGGGGEIAAALTSLGDVARAENDLSEATARYEESLALYRALDFDREWLARVLRHLAEVALDQGDPLLARTRLGESLRTARGLAVRGEPQLAPALEVLAGVAAAQGQAARALRLTGAAAALRAGLRQPPWPIEAAALARWLAPARRTLSEQAQGTAWREGQAMLLEQAIAYALEELAID